jgi:hypothetical protein
VRAQEGDPLSESFGIGTARAFRVRATKGIE